MDIRIHPEVKIGHIHLTVADLDRSLKFYRGLLGFEITSNYGDQAVFLSAGGYHHHIGLNTWQGEGAPPLPANALGLEAFSVLLPNKAELERVLARVKQAGVATEQNEAGTLVHDPSQNGVILTSR